MISLIKADIYRIFRSKGIYITLAILAAFVALTIFVFGAAMTQAGLTINTVDTPYGLQLTSDELANMTDLVERMDTLTNELMQDMITLPHGITAADAVQIAMENVASVMIYFAIPLLVIVSMASFSSGAIKNELSTGHSRFAIYVSKFLLAALLSVLLLAIHLVLSVLFALPAAGFGTWGGGMVANLLQSFLLQGLTMVALMSVGTFLCFATRKTSAVIGLFLAFIWLPVALVQLLSMAFSGALAYMYYDLGNQLMFFANVSANTQLLRGIAIALGYIIVPTVAGIALFKKAEIK